jgi:hypothetical protein
MRGDPSSTIWHCEKEGPIAQRNTLSLSVCQQTGSPQSVMGKRNLWIQAIMKRLGEKIGEITSSSYRSENP